MLCCAGTEQLQPSDHVFQAPQHRGQALGHRKRQFIDSVKHCFGISRRSLKRWQQQLEETRTLARQKSETTGPPRTIPPPLLQVLRDLLDESPASANYNFVFHVFLVLRETKKTPKMCFPA